MVEVAQRNELYGRRFEYHIFKKHFVQQSTSTINGPYITTPPPTNQQILRCQLAEINGNLAVVKLMNCSPN